MVALHPSSRSHMMLLMLVFNFTEGARSARQYSQPVSQEEQQDEQSVHLAAYAQLFRAAANGEDHRTSSNLKLGTSISDDLGTAWGGRWEWWQGGPGGEKNSNPAGATPNALCNMCQNVVKRVTKACCKRNQLAEALTCNANFAGCARSLQYMGMKRSLVDGTGKIALRKRRSFMRVRADLSSLGHILRLKEQGVKPKDICNLAVSETFNCDDDEKWMPNAFADVPVRKFRNAACAGRAGWQTVSMCPNRESIASSEPMGSQASEDASTPMDYPMAASDLKPDSTQIEQDSEQLGGLGFPEMPVTWDWRNGGWTVRTPQSLGYPASYEVHSKTLKKVLEAMPGPSTTAAMEWLGSPEAAASVEKSSSKEHVPVPTYLLRKLVILLYDMEEDRFYIENIPSTVKTMLKMFYAEDTQKGTLARGAFHMVSSLQQIGYDMVQKYENPVLAANLIKHYISDYPVDLSVVSGLTCKLAPPHVRRNKRGTVVYDDCVTQAIKIFPTYNAFFYRKLQPRARKYLCYFSSAEGCRTLRERLGDSFDNPSVVSPADSRLMLVPNLNLDHSFWIKGEVFNLRNLVDLKEQRHYDYYTGGSMIISRLAPQDYHRFHFPVDGKVGPMTHYPGAYYSVNPVAVESEMAPVFTTNKRMHTLIDSKDFGCVLYVSVGATNVGSIVHTSYPGQEVVRGMEHGYMAFGGSTVLMIFPNGAVNIDGRIKRSTRVSAPIETIVRMGQELGTKNADFFPSNLEGSPCSDF